MEFALRFVVGIAVVATACQAAVPKPEAASTNNTVTPCRAAVQGSDLSTWREVVAPDFTFCVPAGWRISGRKASYGSAKIEWGAGKPPRRTGTRTVVVRAGQPVPPGDNDVQRFTENIAGNHAQLYRNRFGAEYYTGVDWVGRSGWVIGEADAPAMADLQIAIYRSVRFSQ